MSLEFFIVGAELITAPEIACYAGFIIDLASDTNFT
jgi:hypothetical protein